MPWYDRVPDQTLAVECEGRTHQLRWAAGHIALDDHPDQDAERVLIALGGAAPHCVELANLWNDAITDGGFLEEWSTYLDTDRRRLWWLGTALERYRNEGVQDFLYNLPRARAHRMCEVILAFPHRFLDIAVGHVIERLDAESWDIGRPELAHIAEAIRLRARRAFVASLKPLRSHARSAALVRLRCRVSFDDSPKCEGRLDGKHSQVSLNLSPGWLGNVWARGLAVHNGRFTVDVSEAGDGTVTLSQVVWRPDPGGPGMRAELEPVTLPNP